MSEQERPQPASQPAPSPADEPQPAPRASRGLSRMIVPSIVLGAVVLLVMAIFADGPELLAALRSFRIEYLVAALALAALNYVIRFLRWHYYLRESAQHVPLRTSASVFFTGLAMSVTPGKVGEVVKCFLLRDRAGVSMSVSMPIVVTERLADLAAVAVLLSAGAMHYRSGRPVFWAGMAIVVAVWLVLTFSPKAVHAVEQFASRFLFKGRVLGSPGEAAETFQRLLTGSRLLVGLVLGVLAWIMECAALFVVLHGFGVTSVSMFNATFAYALATLAGALAMLPGGLGVTEGSLTAALLVFGVARTTAAAATLVVRAATLWFAVAVGLAFYVGTRAATDKALAEAQE